MSTTGLGITNLFCGLWSEVATPCLVDNSSTLGLLT